MKLDARYHSMQDEIAGHRVRELARLYLVASSDMRNVS